MSVHEAHIRVAVMTRGQGVPRRLPSAIVNHVSARVVGRIARCIGQGHFLGKGDFWDGERTPLFLNGYNVVGSLSTTTDVNP